MVNFTATISVCGRFHLFDLARQLLKYNALECLITSYPKFETIKYGIPRQKIKSIIIKELLFRGWQKLPFPLKKLYNPQYIIHEIFDRWASCIVPRADIIIGGSSVFLHTMRKAQGYGAITVLERGSSHMQYQNDILVEEYGKYNIIPPPFALPHPKIIKKELQEYQKVDYISIPSTFVERTFLEKGIPQKKLIKVPYGVDLSSFKQVPKQDNIFRVIFSGGICIRKGAHYLLQAFSELQLSNAELILIGSMNDEMKPFLEKYKGTYNWIGHKPQSELYQYYSKGSVFILPSLEEGLAMVQLQAMACGLPIICTTNTGGEDIVRDGIDGFIIPIRDVEELKEKIVYLYEHPDICREMGQSAKTRVQNGFTWDDYGKKMIAAYQKIINDKKTN